MTYNFSCEEYQYPSQIAGFSHLMSAALTSKEKEILTTSLSHIRQTLDSLNIRYYLHREFVDVEFFLIFIDVDIEQLTSLIDRLGGSAEIHKRTETAMNDTMDMKTIYDLYVFHNKVKDRDL